MARFGVDNEDVGSLRIDDTEKEERIRLYFVPKGKGQNQSVRDQVERNEKLLAEVELEQGVLKIYPIYTLEDHERFLQSKYQQIRTLALKVDLDDLPHGSSESEWSNWLYEQLPRGFVKDFHYGMGLLKDLKRLINVIEENTQCSELVFVAGDGLEVDGPQLIIGFDRFDEIRAEIDRIADRGGRAASRVKDAFVHNALAEELGLSRKGYSLGRHPHSSLIAKAADGIEELSDSEQGLLVDTVLTQSSRIAERAPVEFYRLKHDLELVALDRLIREYEDALGRCEKEEWWQTFFERNKFALHQVFGAPFVYVAGQAPLGTRNLSGNGETIVDYLLRNALTNSVAIVEIKTPSTCLLQNSTYRPDVFSPSAKLSGAVIQVLDQAYELSRRITQIKEGSGNYDLESYAVRCFVIAGRTPSAEDSAKLKSLEMCRYNSRNVTIVTYDDILEQMKILRDFLSSDAPLDAPHPEDES